MSRSTVDLNFNLASCHSSDILRSRIHSVLGLAITDWPINFPCINLYWPRAMGYVTPWFCLEVHIFAHSNSLTDGSKHRVSDNLRSHLCLFSQQISQHQELFIQMLNEPVGEGGDAPEVGDMGAAGEEGAPVNYIQVTPQEKEAIERVSDKRRVNNADMFFLLLDLE